MASLQPPTSSRIACAALLSLVLVPLAGLGHPGDQQRIAILSARIEAEPGVQAHYVARATAFTHAGRYPLAATDLERAEQLGDPLAAAFARAELNSRLGHPRLASAYLARLLAAAPDYTPALEMQAGLLAELGDTPAALLVYERLFATLKQPNPGSYLSAAGLLAAQDPGGAEAAIELLDRGMERLGIIPQLQRRALELELQIGREERALQRLASLRTVLDGSPGWQVDMGELLLRMGRPAAAQCYLTGASGQLAELRSTPARLQLAHRIQGLQAAPTTAAGD